MKRIIIIVIIAFMAIGCKPKQEDSIKKYLMGKKYRDSSELKKVLKDYKDDGGMSLQDGAHKFGLSFFSINTRKVILIEKLLHDGRKLPLAEIIDVITIELKPKQELMADRYWTKKNVVLVYHIDGADNYIVDKAWIASVNSMKTGVDFKEISPGRVTCQMDDEDLVVKLKE